MKFIPIIIVITISVVIAILFSPIEEELLEAPVLRVRFPKKPPFEDPIEKQRQETYREKEKKQELTLNEIVEKVEELVEKFEEKKYTIDQYGYQGEKNDEGFRHGIGKMTVNGSIHIGEWRRNLRHGLGQLITTNRDTYKGEWRFDNQHGKGMLVSGDGDKYAGQWKVGMQDGLGTYFWKDGSKYHGEWKNGNPHGQGTWENKDSKYVGHWVAGKRHGKGKLIRKSDHHVVFQGEFLDGNPFSNTTAASDSNTPLSDSNTPSTPQNENQNTR